MQPRIGNLTSWLSSLRRPAARTGLKLERLEDRATPAVVALFNTDTLTVTSDAAADNITVGADAAGNLTVVANGAAVSIRSTFGSPTRAATKSVTVNGNDGNDTITLDRSLNTLDSLGKLSFSPTASLFGGGGDDKITPLIGGFTGGVIGNPIVGNVVQDGGAGNDTLTSGFGNDLMLGGDGNDTMIWLPGTLIDTYEGGNGTDTGVVVGNDGPATAPQGDAFLLSNGGNGRLRFDRTNLVPFFIDIGTTEVIDLRPGAGNDTIQVNADVAGLGGMQRLVLSGAAGDDQIANFSSTPATISGGDGNDYLEGGTGNDTLNGDAGDDVAVDNAGGINTFNGAGGNDLLSSTVPGATMRGGDGNDTLYDIIGNSNFDAGLGTDIVIGRAGESILNGEQVVRFGTTAATAAIVDGVLYINGTAGNDSITINDAGPNVVVNVNGQQFTFGRASFRSIAVLGGDGADMIDNNTGDANAATAVFMVAYGGNGNDDLRGSAGFDFLKGGAGDDLVSARSGGGDVISGDAGADQLFADNGAGVVSGVDTLLADARDSILTDGTDVVTGLFDPTFRST